LFRRILSDDHYFNKKTYATCFCDTDHRPKFPSQATTLKGIDFGRGGNPAQSVIGDSIISDGNDNSPTPSIRSVNSSGKMLGKLRDAASLAISVTTGKKLNLPMKS
jgi:hypothetical protein